MFLVILENGFTALKVVSIHELVNTIVDSGGMIFFAKDGEERPSVPGVWGLRQLSWDKRRFDWWEADMLERGCRIASAAAEIAHLDISETLKYGIDLVMKYHDYDPGFRRQDFYRRQRPLRDADMSIRGMYDSRGEYARKCVRAVLKGFLVATGDSFSMHDEAYPTASHVRPWMLEARKWLAHAQYDHLPMSWDDEMPCQRSTAISAAVVEERSWQEQRLLWYLGLRDCEPKIEEAIEVQAEGKEVEL